jgi:hypothetical protein
MTDTEVYSSEGWKALVPVCEEYGAICFMREVPELMSSRVYVAIKDDNPINGEYYNVVYSTTREFISRINSDYVTNKINSVILSRVMDKAIDNSVYGTRMEDMVARNNERRFYSSFESFGFTICFDKFRKIPRQSGSFQRAYHSLINMGVYFLDEDKNEVYSNSFDYIRNNEITVKEILRYHSLKKALEKGVS